MDVATLFLMLALVITRAIVRVPYDLIAKLSSFWICSLILLLHSLKGWKEKWSEKVSITLLPGDSSEWRELKEG